MTTLDTFRRVFCVFLLLALVALSMVLTSCAGKTVKTTTTRMGMSGVMETIVTETPYVDPFKAMQAEAGRLLMQTEF